jgi:hypothetical protein
LRSSDDAEKALSEHAAHVALLVAGVALARVICTAAIDALGVVLDGAFDFPLTRHGQLVARCPDRDKSK